MSASYNYIGRGYIFLSTFISSSIIFLFIVILSINSLPAIHQVGFDLLSLTWYPPQQQFGILSMLYGSMVVTFIALLLAVPLGVLSAIFIAEFLPANYRIYVKTSLEVLAGIPSIIYGLIGIALLTTWVGNIFHLQTGRTLFSAGLLLSVMVLPTIITLSDDALKQVPQQYKEAATGLGLYPYEVIISVTLSIAKGGIIGAILLAFGRALGETMAVMLVIGGIDKIPDPMFNLLVSGQTITSKLGREIAESAFGSIHFSALVFMGLVLLIIVLILTALSLYYFKIGQRLDD